LLGSHQAEVIRVRRYRNLAFREFPREDTTVEILKFQTGKRGSRARRVRENQPQRWYALACAPEPSREHFESWLFAERTDNIGGSSLKHANIAMEFSQHFDQVLVDVKPLVE